MIGTTGWAGSAMNVQRNVAEDVIPELDENMTTIISMRGERKPPTVHDIFGIAPTPSAPVDIPAQSAAPRLNIMDTVSAREKFFLQQEKRPKRPTQLSVSVPVESSNTVGDTHMGSVPESGIAESQESSSQESVVATSAPSLSPDTGFQSELKSDNLSEEGKEDPDLSMDDMQVSNRKQSEGGGSLAKKLAKTFGLKDKDNVPDDKSEVHLLSDVSRIKEDSDDEDDNDDEEIKTQGSTN